MSAEAESLRRSKRNKYFLDVSVLTASPERRKSLATSVATSPEPTPHIHDDSPGPSVEKESTSPIPLEEENKRSRRPTKNNNFVYADESDEEDESKTAVGMVGPHSCTKCPSRFETRPGLANHARLHGTEKRKFSCTICDFSCGSSKAIRNHRRCHNTSARIIKEESPSQTHSDTRSDTSESHTPPQLTPVRGVPTSQTPTFGERPPQLDAVSPTEPPAKKSDKSSNRKRNRCPECPFAVRNRRRFEAHILSHRRTTGFQCHSCTLKTLSSGFLKRHIVEVHKETSYPWPPTFVNGAAGDEKPVSSDVEPPRPSSEKLEKRRKHRGKMLMRDAIRRGNYTVCPVDGCSHECYSSKQLVFHKRRHHSDKANLAGFRCSQCGLRLRTTGALKLHRIAKHPTQKINPKAKKLLCSEAMPRFFLKHLLLDMAAKSNGLSVPPTMDSAPSTPGTVSPAPTLTVSHSAPSLMTLGGLTVSSSLLGMDLPECLRGIDFDKAELETEFQKNQEHEFSCEECPFATSAKAKLERHVSRHQIKSDVQCPLCSFSCRGDDIIKTHVRLHMAVIHHQQQEAEKLVANLPSIFIGSSPSSEAPSTPTTELPPPTPSPSLGGKVTITPGTGRPNGQIPAKPIPTPQAKGGKRKAFPNTSFVSKGGMRMRRCLECPYVTRHSCDLLSHYNMHTTKPQRYKCSQCSYSTKRAVCLRSHYQSHREQNAEKSVRKPLRLVLNGAFSGIRTGGGQFRIYSCARCPFVSRTLVNLWHHMRSHLFRLDSAFKCSVCSFYGRHVDDLEEHLLLHEETASTERIILASTPSLKRALPEPKEKAERPPKSRRVTSARVSPDPPVLVKEEPIDIKEDETDESNDCKYESTASTSSSRSSTVPAMDAPLSVVVEELVKPEAELLVLLRREHKAEEVGKCPDCPFEDPDELVMRIHREQHRGPARPMKCDLCSFSCVTPEALHHHISLHLPALSPNSAAAERRKAAQRRRSQISELIPLGVPHFACTKCSFRTMTKDAYQEHMLAHAQELQRRLLTNIKRSNQEAKPSKIIRRTPKKADKFYCCNVCSFRCETLPAYYRHQEMHTLNGMHKCAICSYSANTLSITQFHEMNHHSDHTLSSMTKTAVLAPHAISLDVTRTENKIQKMADNVYRCNRCPEFICYEILDMRRHYESLHNETEADKQVVESLALGMLPMNSIVTLA